MLRDVRDPRTYRRLLYVLLALPLSTLYFSLLVSGLSTGLGLAVTLAGLPILAAMLLAWRWMAGLERRLAGALLGEDIPDPVIDDADRSWWARLRARLVAASTWKDLAYLLLLFPLSLATFTIAVMLIAASLGLLVVPAWYWALPDGIQLGALRIDTLGEALVAVPVGAILGLASLRIANWLGMLHGAFARAMLSAGRDAELEAQVVDLSTARARIFAATDAERRRIERNLHDGAQQRLVALTLTLGLARRQLGQPDGRDEGLQSVADAEAEARLAIQELRELARGIHPAILTDRGLDAALRELSRRAGVQVDVDGEVGERLPEPVEAAAYFVVSEALANVGKYAEAETARVVVAVDGAELRVVVADDGRGGADPSGGTGLRGLTDRVAAAGGTLTIDSRQGQGTSLSARIPVAHPEPPEEEEPTEQAVAGERRRRRVLDHAAVFAVVNVLLVAIWAVTGAGYFWPIWPLLGWGAVLALHAWLALGRGHRRVGGPAPAP